MQLDDRYSLSQLLGTFHRGAALAEGDASTEAGLRAVLEMITDAARIAAANNPERYDHRSLYEFTAALDHAVKQPIPEQVA